MELSQIDPDIFANDCPGLVIGGHLKIGGQKRVWKCAYHESAYVLKALMADSSTLKRVERELRVMEQCRSEFLPKLGPVSLRALQLTSGERVLYFLEEYIDGQPLASVASPLDWRDVVHLGLCISEALSVLSTAGYVHRDVKPMNIIRKNRTVYVLIDAGFTLARHEARITFPTRGITLGTQPYLSPDQLTLHPSQLDVRSDLFALAATMYEFAAGVHPFENDDAPAGHVVFNIAQYRPNPPRLLQPSSSAGVGRRNYEGA